MASIVTTDLDLHRVPSILRTVCELVTLDELTPEQLRAIIGELFRLQDSVNGAGLAAPQIGLALRLATVWSRERPPFVLINPRLVDATERMETDVEGCLSLPGWQGQVKRPAKVLIENDTLDGEGELLELEGFTGRVALHEMDHLEGVLYVDRALADTMTRVDEATPTAQ
jgi:peptide deformylase